MKVCPKDKILLLLADLDCVNTIKLFTAISFWGTTLQICHAQVLVWPCFAAHIEFQAGGPGLCSLFSVSRCMTALVLCGRGSGSLERLGAAAVHPRDAQWVRAHLVDIQSSLPPRSVLSQG